MTSLGQRDFASFTLNFRWSLIRTVIQVATGKVNPFQQAIHNGNQFYSSFPTTSICTSTEYWIISGLNLPVTLITHVIMWFANLCTKLALMPSRIAKMARITVNIVKAGGTAQNFMFKFYNLH
jgi:hypothetical protein